MGFMSEQAGDSEKAESPEVKVSDRRRFSSEGEARDPSEVDEREVKGSPDVTAAGAAAEAPASAAVVGGPPLLRFLCYRLRT